MEKFVDEKLHELTKHGEDEFPIALYGDSYYLYGNRFYYSHYHEEIEILFVTQGEISVDVNENTYRIKKGDILVGMDGNFNLGVWNDIDGLLNQRVCKLFTKIHF